MPQKAAKGFHEVDFRVGVSLGVAVLLYYIADLFVTNLENYISLCALAISAAFLADMGPGITWKSGLTRITVTLIGCIAAFIPVAFYNLVPNDFLLVPVVVICAVLAIVIVKMTNVLYVQCRITMVSYVLTIFTYHGAYYAQIGKSCYMFGISRIVSTILGALVAVATIYVWEAVKKLFVKKVPAGKA